MRREFDGREANNQYELALGGDRGFENSNVCLGDHKLRRTRR
jgi:hypothetical protein